MSGSQDPMGRRSKKKVWKTPIPVDLFPTPPREEGMGMQEQSFGCLLFRFTAKQYLFSPSGHRALSPSPPGPGRLVQDRYANRHWNLHPKCYHWARHQVLWGSDKKRLGGAFKAPGAGRCFL